VAVGACSNRCKQRLHLGLIHLHRLTMIQCRSLLAQNGQYGLLLMAYLTLALFGTFLVPTVVGSFDTR